MTLKLVLVIALLAIFLFFCIVAIIKLTKNIAKLKKENKELSHDFEVIYDAQKKNEKRKESMETGNAQSDFNASVGVLSDLAKRKY